jgi:hypothetical protein
MAENWDSHVNTKFYGQDSSYNENTEKVEFKSGRTIRYLKNTLPKKKHIVNIQCKDKGTAKTDGKTEFEWFLYWYENTIKSGTKSFYLTDIVTGNETKEYIITEVPSWTGQKYKEISLTLEEV